MFSKPDSARSEAYLAANDTYNNFYDIPQILSFLTPPHALSACVTQSQKNPLAPLCCFYAVAKHT